ncbi:MAG: lauroyl acyltransferase [Desulfopila sp.]
MYRLLVQLTNWCGPWFFILVARTIAVGYFLVPRRRRESCRFYHRLFPGRHHLFHLWCTFRQFQNFTTIHLDRYLANCGRTVASSLEGQEALDAVLGDSGAILLMSHCGNWEMAARLLMDQQRDVRLLLYMGAREKEGVEKTQKEELRRAGVRIVAADQGGSSPFAMVDGLRLLREGGTVSLAGDQLWHERQRWLAVSFLGGVARLPESPFVLAMVSGAPLHVFFALRRQGGGYRLVFKPPITVPPTVRGKREAVLQEAAQRYADLLEESVRLEPCQWYHFQRFVR